MPIPEQVRQQVAPTLTEEEARERASQLAAELAVGFDAAKQSVSNVPQGTQAPVNPFPGAQLDPNPPDTFQPGASPGWLANVLAGTVKHPETKMALYAAAFFPEHVDQETGVVSQEILDNFRVTDQGEVVYRDDQGVLREAKGSDVADHIGRFASMMPEITGGAVGGLIGLATGHPVVGAGIGSAAGAGGKRLFAETVLGEPRDVTANAIDLGIEFALGATGERVGIGLGNLGRSLSGRAGQQILNDQVRDVSIRDITAKIARIEASTGIKLDVAQASGLASLQQVRKFLLNHAGRAGNILQSNKLAQNGQIDEAVEVLLNTLADPKMAGTASERGMNAATASIRLAKQQRTNATAPMYRQAYDESGPIDTSSVIAEIDDMLPKAKGKAAPVLQKLRREMHQKTKTGQMLGPVEDLETLHNVRGDVLEPMIEDAVRDNNGKLANRLIKIKETLDETLDANAPEIWHTAQAKFSQLSREFVDPLVDGPIGSLARVKGPRVANRMATFLRGAGTDNPSLGASEIKALRTIIERQGPDGPEIWRGLMRNYLKNAMDVASKKTQDQTLNVSGKFLNSVFNRPSQQQALKAALPHDVMPVFDDIIEAMDLIARAGGAGGSPTQPFQAIEKGIRGASVAGRVETFAGDVKVGIAKQILGDSADEAFKRNTANIADALVDPSKWARLNTLKDLPMTWDVGLQILSIAGFLGTGEELGVGVGE